ncbi:Uncharacterized protein SCG7086_AG_00130 [Chlamydiales bacterium SCGC AG-110-P3]|nr:Uncharacterized protein SCG7086_AG_00130 [Chlamydiales bacterium SCGC AG-110-P3]
MHYYVDGYNLLFYLSENPGSTLEDQREQLLETINYNASLLNLSVTVVFDAGASPVTHRFTHCNIEVAFADSSTNADQWIYEHVEHNKNPKIVTVVTNDRRLALDCKQLGAKVQSVAAWMRKLEKAGGRNKQKIRKHERSARSTPPPQASPTNRLVPGNAVDKQATKPEPEPLSKADPKLDSKDPSFLKRQQGETEQERWQRIFESRL